jgi:hypothetical protein
MTLHADHIGSLLRPPELLEARAAHDRGDLSDGEYRRSWFAGGLPSVVDGLHAFNSYRPGATDAYPDTTSMIDHIVEIMADEVAQLSQEDISREAILDKLGLVVSVADEVWGS